MVPTGKTRLWQLDSGSNLPPWGIVNITVLQHETSCRMSLPPEALAKMHKMHELLKVDRVEGKRMGKCFKHPSASLNVSNVSELCILACSVEVLSKSRLCMAIPMRVSMMSASPVQNA